MLWKGTITMTNTSMQQMHVPNIWKLLTDMIRLQDLIVCDLIYP